MGIPESLCQVRVLRGMCEYRGRNAVRPRWVQGGSGGESHGGGYPWGPQYVGLQARPRPSQYPGRYARLPTCAVTYLNHKRRGYGGTRQLDSCSALRDLRHLELALKPFNSDVKAIDRVC